MIHLIATPHSMLAAELEALSQQLAITIESDDSLLAKDDLVVTEREGVLVLLRHLSKEHPVMVDFVNGAVAHRRKFGGGKGQDIAKAVGLNKGVTPSVLDATGGLGRDAFVLATLGCKVTVVERSPVIAALLKDGLRRALLDAEVAPIAEKITLIHANSIEWMQHASESFDVVYLDPMFPHREKSALVKKEMRLFQDLIGEDVDSSGLLAPALNIAEHRVVVKRPRLAPLLSEQKPTYQLEGKSCRHDIYVNRAFDS